MNKKTIIAALVIVAAVLILVLAVNYFYINRPFDKETQQKLEQLLDDSLEKYKSPGIMMSISIPGRGNWFGKRGQADIATGREMDIKDKYRIGSLTKTFTATVLLQLVDEGKIGLDDTLDKYMPDIPNAKNITIRQLLNMTSGFYDCLEVPRVGKKILADRFMEWDPTELVKAGVSHKPYFAPGKGYHYSNTNYDLIGLIIEQLTNDKLENQIKKRIINKLGLRNTSFPEVPYIELPYMHGYFDPDGSGKLIDWTEQNPSWAWAAGAIISNMGDMKKYIKTLSDGTFLSQELQQQRLTDWIDMSPNLKTLKYGLGVFTFGGYVGHNGGQPGYVDMAMYNPEDGGRIVFVLNRQPEDEAATLKIFNELLKILYPGKEI